MTFTEIGPFLKLISSLKNWSEPVRGYGRWIRTELLDITAHGLTELDVHDDLVPHCGVLYDAVSTVIQNRFIDKQ